MQIRQITLRYAEGLQGFPEDALREATAGREVLEVREHFFVHGGVPHLAAPVTEGLPFLGWRVYPALLRQQGARLRRQRRLLRQREAAFVRGEISAEALRDSVRALAGPRRFLGFGEPLRSTLDV